jgi:hypothetical protein
MVRLMTRRIVPLILLALLLAGVLSTAAAAKEPIAGPGYRTHAPSGWHVDKQSSAGWRMVTITPPGHAQNQRDTALISIAVTSVKKAEKASGTSIRNKTKMVQKLISIPSQNVFGVERSFPPRKTTLAHKKGVMYGVHYNYKGKGSQHNATLVRRGRRIYLVQVITDEDLSPLSSSAANMVTDDWRWK